MPVFSSDYQPKAGGRWTGTTAEQRRARMRKPRLAQAVNELVNSWPELKPEQIARLRTLLQPPQGGEGR